jgi:hypothetical protein
MRIRVISFIAAVFFVSTTSSFAKADDGPT